jgi:galactoside O-acetyltransferase
MSFLSEDELKAIGFRHVGKNVRISCKASFYNPARISIGDNSRIDDFCILSAGSGGISIGKYMHIGCYSYLLGQGAITLEDFSGVSGRVAIYSSNDDYSGNSLTNPTVPEIYRNVSHGPVVLRKHAIVGAGSIILPNVEIGVGAVVGAMSLVKHNCSEFGVYAGIPARRIGERRRDLLELAKKFLNTHKHD